MNISFDLDGVICNSEKWFYGILYSVRNIQPLLLLESIEILYYSTRQIRYNPYQFMSPQDKGYIITARKPVSHLVTEEWLDSHGISLPIIYVDNEDTIDWSNYEEASCISASRKAGEIECRGIGAHFDNNPYVVRQLRILLPKLTVIQVGGEPCLSSM